MFFAQVTRRTRWQKSILWFCTGSLVSFIANLTFTIWATTRPGSNIQNGVGVLSEETSCSRAKTINTGVHVLINIISTILLAGSNYCMQCLSAPTREEIDEAHRQSRWVDVGVPSIRNLFYTVSGGNVILWALLSLSSLPLHLFYNSAIFTSISTNEYNITLVPSNFLTQPSPNLQTPQLQTLRDAALSGRLTRLPLSACIDAYASNFQSTRSDLLLVTTNATFSLPAPATKQATYALQNLGCGMRQAYQWMCSQREGRGSVCVTPCEDVVGEFRARPDTWRPLGVAGVQECYSLPTEERCKLLFSPVLCWVVTGLNLVKGVLMLVTGLRGGGRRAPLLTVGDAVASFMAVPDETTVDMCLVGKGDVVSGGGLWSKEPREVRGRRSKFAAARPGRWLACVVMYVLAILSCIVLYMVGIAPIVGAKDFSSLMALGLGTLSSKTIMQTVTMGRGWSSLLRSVLLANTPQVVMSLLYFTYNGLFTSIALATEWDNYARRRKGLRVSSSPVGAQRTTYFLQLPYRYSLPLLVISGLLHWLISQSIFLVFVEIYRDSVADIGAGTGSDKTKRVAASDYTTCGWSPAGVVSVIIVGIAMVLFLLFSGSRRLGSSMPVAGSCSAAISAACHPVPYDKMVGLEPLQWGVTSFEGDEKAHCSFSSGEVDAPKRGVMYS